MPQPITYLQLATRVLHQVQGMTNTDDSQVSVEEVIFILSAEAAKLISQKAMAMQQELGTRYRKFIDPSLRRDYEVDIPGEGEAVALPATPITLPFDDGIQSALVQDPKTGRFVAIKPSNFQEVVASQGAPYRTPRLVRSGDVIRFYGVGKAKAILSMLSFDLPSGGSPEISPFPISADLVPDLVMRAAQAIMMAKASPADEAKDLKDPSVTR